MTTPLGAIKQSEEPADPVLKFSFAVMIGGKTAGWFTECSGLSVQREVVEHKEGGVNDHTHQLPGRVTQSRITLKRGLADDVLWKWFDRALADGKLERHNVSIILYNSDRTKMRQWDLKEAFPAKWTGPDFQSDSNQIAMESIELVHHGLEMQPWTAARARR